MSIELIRDLIKIDQTMGKNQTQSLVEGEMTLPADKPEMNQILTMDGDVKIVEIKTLKDKILVKGIVELKALYTAEDEKQPVHSLTTTIEFDEEMEMDGILEQMTADIRANIEHIEYRLEQRDRIAVKAVIALEGKAQAGNDIDIVKDIKGNENLQVLKENIKYDDVIGHNIATTTVRDAFEVGSNLADILDILRIDMKAYERETKIVDDKVIVSGLIECSVMYFGDDEENKINYMKHEIQFTHFVEVYGATKDMLCNIKLQPGEVTYDTKEDINGNIRILDVEVLVKIEAKIYEQKEKEVTIDTYSTVNKVNVKKQEVDITENVGRHTAKEIIKGTVETDTKVETVYNINVKPMLTDYRIVEERIIIEGFLDVDMLYLGEIDEGIKNIKQEIPFKAYADMEKIQTGMDSDIDIILDDIKYNKMSQGGVEIEVTIKTDVSVNRVKKINIITSAEEIEEKIDESKKASITIYIVQDKDTIWDIAKRYNTTIEELVETNEIINPENIMPGEKLIIEKNISFEI